MRVERVAPATGAVAAALLCLLVAFPAVAVTDPRAPVGAYYASGPLGATVVAVLGLFGVIVFLAGVRGATDADLIAGVASTLTVAAFALAALWAVSVDQTVLYSFPPGAAWIVSHRWAVVAVAAVLPVCAAAYARAAR